MAKIIPAYIADDKTSLAERKIFSQLKDDPDTAEWMVLHSLELARRGKKKPYGEIDFVVIIPAEGIICLEIKGGGISCEGGQWKTTNRHGQEFLLKKSPFEQARDSMYALRNSIMEHFGKDSRESRCPIGYGVVFPDAHCPPLTPEFERSDVIDFQDLRDRPIYSGVMNIVRNRLREFKPRGEKPAPTHPEAKRISGFLRPDFERVAAKATWLEEAEEKLLRLTEEQYEIIDQLEDNPRCLFEGAAGTGKTLLALEFSRRAELFGKKVLLVCYNQLLSQRFGEWTEDTGITAGTFHGVVESLIMNSKWKQEFLERKSELESDQKKLFEEVYPFYGEMALEELGPQFDLLVMDEAQDLCREEILCVLDGAIRGGLSGGRWAIFGDFSRQNIYNQDEEKDPLATLGKYCRHPARNRLTRNCRNTRHIAEETCLLSGFDSPPSRFVGKQGPPVEYEYWKSSGDFLGLIERKIRGLLQGGISLEDIVILSPRRLESSTLAHVKKICGFPLEDASRSLCAMRKKKVVKFSTIHSFKGLESRVVIVVDIDEVRGSRAQSLLYVSMSRAKSLLILIINEQTRKSIDGIKKSRGKTVSV